MPFRVIRLYRATAISLIEMFTRVPNQDAARSYMEAQRWPNGPACPHCAETDRIQQA